MSRPLQKQPCHPLMEKEMSTSPMTSQGLTRRSLVPALLHALIIVMTFMLTLTVSRAGGVTHGAVLNSVVMGGAAISLP